MTEQWWDDEAERLNQMAELVKKNKVTISVGADMPALNPDGSEKKQRTLTQLLSSVKKKKKGAK